MYKWYWVQYICYKTHFCSVLQRHPINRLLMEKLVHRLETDGIREKFENTGHIIQYISACNAKDDEDRLYLDKYE